ncbi:MAG: amidohydrolase [Chloroflexota bacterium]
MGPEAQAEVALVGGVVQPVDPSRPRAEAVAIGDGRILAVGTDRDVWALVGPRTRLIELRGRTVLPGFQDCHLHPTGYGTFRQQVYLHDKGTRDAYAETIADYAAAHPEAEWILGGGWSMDQFPGGTPRREELDRIVPDRPVYLVNRDVHGAWVNSRALELAGITAATPDPPGGRIERDPDGTPSGTLHEWARFLVERLVPPTSADQLEEAIRIAQRDLHSLGITAWQDAWIEPDDEAAYRALAGRGELTARVRGALWWRPGGDESQVDELLARRAAGPLGRFDPGTVKIMVDGVLENYTGALLAPYLDRDGRPTDNVGISFNDPLVLRRAVTRLDAAGVQVHFHAIGDRACREALDAIEAARLANGPEDGRRRHHIAHLQLIHPADIPRFRSLEVTGSIQPLWACYDAQMTELTIPFLGPERTRWQYPFRSLLDAGARLAGGSDLPVSTANVFEQLEVAVNRVPPWDRSAEPFLPEQRLSLDEAIAAFTIGSAYVNHLDDRTGSITPGKLADLVVVDRDLFDRGAGPIGAARAVLTLVEGEVVFEDQDLEG